VHSEERRQQHLRTTIFNSIICAAPACFGPCFVVCGLTFFSDLLHFDTGHINIKGPNAVASRVFERHKKPCCTLLLAPSSAHRRAGSRVEVRSAIRIDQVCTCCQRAVLANASIARPVSPHRKGAIDGAQEHRHGGTLAPILRLSMGNHSARFIRSNSQKRTLSGQGVTAVVADHIGARAFKANLALTAETSPISARWQCMIQRTCVQRLVDR
jgi:hypothetical protein